MTPHCVGAVIVTYRPDLEALTRSLLALRPQVARVWVVDNGSGATTVQALQDLADRQAVDLLALPDNQGIASAQNAGLAALAAAGLDGVLLMDQDSVADPRMVEHLCQAYADLSAGGARVAAVGPRWVDQRSGRDGCFYRIRGGRIRPVSPANDMPVPVDFLIASGSLISCAALSAIGTMREDLFIDHVDTEWCARAVAAGWRLHGVPAARLSHELGDSSQRVWLGRWREVAVHSPLRNYYEVRNTIVLIRDATIPPGWRFAQVVRLAQLLVFYGMFVAPRVLRCRLMAHGLQDGWRDRLGPGRDLVQALAASSRR